MDELLFGRLRMKVLLLTNSNTLSIPAIKKIKDDGLLVGVGVLKKHVNLLASSIHAAGVAHEEILQLERSSWVEELSLFIKEHHVETVWVLTFPWVIPESLLSVLPNRFVNFHFGLLPKYKGADPIFWQLKNSEELGGVTIHLMNDQVDEGPVLLKEELRVIPGENYGLHSRRLGEMVPSMVEKILSLLKSQPNEFLTLKSVDKAFDQKPTEDDLTIKWGEQSATEIEYLINATNPKYGGAFTVVAGVEMRILEVTPVSLEQAAQAEPGQIVHADVVYGVVVACINNEYLRITVVNTAEGYMSGVKLFNLGFLPGQWFTS